jgi:hypothetical protein
LRLFFSTLKSIKQVARRDDDLGVEKFFFVFIEAQLTSAYSSRVAKGIGLSIVRASYCLGYACVHASLKIIVGGGAEVATRT